MNNYMDKMNSIIKANNKAKSDTKMLVHEFLNIQEEFLTNVRRHYDQLPTISHVANILVDEKDKRVLEEYDPLREAHVAICGYNSAGKTSFIHEFLGCGKFLPAKAGACTARIVKFSYADRKDALLIQYTSIENDTVIEHPISLSEYFEEGKDLCNNQNGLRTLLKAYLERPECNDPDSFSEWAKVFIEIRLPSTNLKQGLHMYDTPGFLGSDEPVLRENLIGMVKRFHPTLVFLYDNSTVSDDSRKCYQQLKTALNGDTLDVNVFFLNTKLDVEQIRLDAENDGDDSDDTTLVDRRRRSCYEHLMKCKELKGDVHHLETVKKTNLDFDQCDSFDIFTTLSARDPIATEMRKNAIDKITRFSTKYDLKHTRQIINIVQTTIDIFFSFVLVTNRRSSEEWNSLRDEALQWGDKYFKEYRSNIENIINQLKHMLPQRFEERRKSIETQAIENAKQRSFTYSERYLYLRFRHKSDAAPPEGIGGALRDCGYIDKTFTDTLVQQEVVKPMMSKVFSDVDLSAKKAMSDAEKYYRMKNELLYASLKILQNQNPDMMNWHAQVKLPWLYKFLVKGIFKVTALITHLGHSYLKQFEVKPADERNAEQYGFEHRANVIRHHLVDIEQEMKHAADKLKDSIEQFIDDNQNLFESKVKAFHALVLRTLDCRQEAFKLAREYAWKFARIETHLAACLDLADHDGIQPEINLTETLGSGGFFTVHPATWKEDQLVVKKMKEEMQQKHLVYLEAHFHRKITQLSKSHIVPLKYLYLDEDQSLLLFLPRYSQNLRSYLERNISKIDSEHAMMIVHSIVSVISLFHSYDLVHRDIKPENILLDSAGKVYLADFGTCQHGNENVTIIGSGFLSDDVRKAAIEQGKDRDNPLKHCYDGQAFDVYLLGKLMFICAPKQKYIAPETNIIEMINDLDRKTISEDYYQLMLECLNDDPRKRPKARDILEKLGKMSDHFCIVCFDERRRPRFKPCEHKVVCNSCWSDIQKTRDPLTCIYCNQPIESIDEDAMSNTFIGLPMTTR